MFVSLKLALTLTLSYKSVFNITTPSPSPLPSPPGARTADAAHLRAVREAVRSVLEPEDSLEDSLWGEKSLYSTVQYSKVQYSTVDYSIV